MVIKIGKPSPYGATPLPATTPAPAPVVAPVAPKSGKPAPYKTQPATQVAAPTAPQAKQPMAHPMGNTVSRMVQDMQQAMINFALDVSESDFANKTPKRRRDTDEQGRHLGGGMPFAKFIVQQYMNPEGSGQQFLSAPQTTKQRQELSSKDMELSGVISTIKTIGATGKENKPDGVWGPRTTNSLTNISKFISAMLSLAEDMGLSMKSYDRSRSDTLNKLVMSGKHTEIVAAAIAKELTDVRRFYDEFKTTVFENPQYKDFIDQEKPFAQHNQMTNSLSEQEQTLYNQASTTAIPGLTLEIEDTSLPVSLWDIASMENFKKFLNQNGIKSTTDENVQTYVQSLNTKLGGM